MALAGQTYRAVVRPEDDGLTVLDVHVARFTHSDAEAWRAHVAAGRVLVNGRAAACEHLVRRGDALEFRRPGWAEPDVPLTFGVVHEDEHVLVVDKPAGLQVLPAGRFSESTLLRLVRESAPDRAEASPAHRLGRGTSGLLAFGKTASARASLAAQFRERTACKLYLAIVRCERDLPGAFVASQRIGPVQHEGARVHAASPFGRASLTRVRVLARGRGADVALVAARPVTGRPDQIRIHLAASGCPIVGDPLFAADGRLLPGARPGDVGYLLHAVRLRLRHPATGQWLRLRLPPPPAWRAWHDLRA